MQAAIKKHSTPARPELHAMIPVIDALRLSVNIHMEEGETDNDCVQHLKTAGDPVGERLGVPLKVEAILTNKPGWNAGTPDRSLEEGKVWEEIVVMCGFL